MDASPPRVFISATFVCAEDFPYADYEPEIEEFRALQQSHLEGLKQRIELYYEVRTPDELLQIVLRIPAGREAYLRAIEEQSREHAAILSSKDEEIRFLRAQLERQTPLTEQVAAKMEIRGMVADGSNRNKAPAAQAEVARERGLSLEHLRGQLDLERSDVRKLVDQIAEEREAAVAHAEAWTSLQREAPARLGHAEYAGGHFREAIEQFRLALALFDREEDSLGWCIAAEHLNSALWRQGLYTEAESLPDK